MYIHLGQETVVNEKDIIGIFDLESTTISKRTKIEDTNCKFMLWMTKAETLCSAAKRKLAKTYARKLKSLVMQELKYMLTVASSRINHCE